MKRVIYRTYEIDEATGAETRTANVAIPLFVIYLLRYLPAFVVRLLLRRAEIEMDSIKIEGISLREALCIGYDILTDFAAEQEYSTLSSLIFEIDAHVSTYHILQPLTEEELQVFPPEVREQVLTDLNELRFVSTPASRLELRVE